MNALNDARVHLGKAREFLEAAEISRDLALFNAATSDSVIAGINAKDAICLALTGKTSKSDDHAEAIPELRRAGRAGAEVAPTLARLLKLKTRAQYTPVAISASDASRAVEWGQRLVAAADRVVAGD